MYTDAQGIAWDCSAASSKTEIQLCDSTELHPSHETICSSVKWETRRVDCQKTEIWGDMNIMVIETPDVAIAGIRKNTIIKTKCWRNAESVGIITASVRKDASTHIHAPIYWITDLIGAYGNSVNVNRKGDTWSWNRETSNAKRRRRCNNSHMIGNYHLIKQIWAQSFVIINKWKMNVRPNSQRLFLFWSAQPKRWVCLIRQISQKLNPWKSHQLVSNWYDDIHMSFCTHSCDVGDGSYVYNNGCGTCENTREDSYWYCVSCWLLGSSMCLSLLYSSLTSVS